MKIGSNRIGVHVSACDPYVVVSSLALDRGRTDTMVKVFSCILRFISPDGILYLNSKLKSGFCRSLGITSNAFYISVHKLKDMGMVKVLGHEVIVDKKYYIGKDLKGVMIVDTGIV